MWTGYKLCVFNTALIGLFDRSLLPAIMDKSIGTNLHLWRLFTRIHLHQEIIKVREWICHIGPLTKVIRLKLFLDIVPSSSEDITRAMRQQPKQLSRNYLRKIVATSYYTFWSRFIPDMFSALSAAFFVQSGISFVFLLVWLFIILPFIRF